MNKGKVIVGVLGVSLLVSVPFIYHQVLGAEIEMGSGYGLSLSDI